MSSVQTKRNYLPSLWRLSSVFTIEITGFLTSRTKEVHTGAFVLRIERWTLWSWKLDDWLDFQHLTYSPCSPVNLPSGLTRWRCRIASEKKAALVYFTLVKMAATLKVHFSPSTSPARNKCAILFWAIVQSKSAAGIYSRHSLPAKRWSWTITITLLRISSELFVLLFGLKQIPTLMT